MALILRFGLGVRRWGDGPEPLVLLHGFTGAGIAFDHLRPLIGARAEVAALDLPGHGGSPVVEGDGWDASVERVADAVADAFGRPVHLAGYSLGARLALAVALARPACVHSLVLESGSAGIEDETGRAARRASDEALAASLERDGLEAFVARWEQNDVLAGLRALPPERAAALRARRLAGSAAGLAWSLRALGQGAQADLWPRLAEVRAPALVLHGALDAKYAALAQRLAAGLPRARLLAIAGAGHSPHLEQPEAFAAALLAHLDQHPANPRPRAAA